MKTIISALLLTLSFTTFANPDCSTAIETADQNQATSTHAMVAVYEAAIEICEKEIAAEDSTVLALTKYLSAKCEDQFNGSGSIFKVSSVVCRTKAVAYGYSLTSRID